jgi:hypothetical protein
MSETSREAKVRVKEVRRTPQQESPGVGTRFKKKLPKKKRGEYKIRVTRMQIRPGLEGPYSYIWNHYRDEAAALGAFRTLGTRYSFYFLEVVDPEGKVIVDNKEAYEACKARDRKLRSNECP